MTIRVRAFVPADKDFILSLVARFSGFDLPEWRTANMIDIANQKFLQKALEQSDPNSAFFIAEDENGQRAGFIHLQTQTDHFTGENHGYISELAVDKSFEGQGVGRALLEKAEEWARQKNYRLLTLYVFAGNERARQLYERNGFQQELVKYAKVIELNT
jgi:ribosomal protein S18 acetylase RimI-like enzyme